LLSPTPTVAAVWAPTGIEAIEGRAKDPPPFSGPLLNPGPSLIQVLLYPLVFGCLAVQFVIDECFVFVDRDFVAMERCITPSI